MSECLNLENILIKLYETQDENQKLKVELEKIKQNLKEKEKIINYFSNKYVSRGGY